ncbi:MAG: nicotinate-nicotinamide nucleotide adenylyltransferase, partial [Planctomycetia bacterium]
MRIGVFGGSFESLLVCQLVAAEWCREQAALDRVLFVPAAIQPHKRDRQLAAGHHRLEMLALATGGNDAFAVHADEVERGGVSYTVDTLERLAARHPGDELLLLLGPDVAATLPTWRSPERIVAIVEPVFMERLGVDAFTAPAFRSALEPLLGRERLDRLLAARRGRWNGIWPSTGSTTALRPGDRPQQTSRTPVGRRAVVE